ncbi:unnamed protein product [Cuscuta campestris]|uniref:PCI domain-containing protein n=1 Tax=Cuscuta campestris TaxID=132261 RepID=A0A484KAE2_9ASTE|nr:unnamed protein product [Cuscuta campestris]
MGKSLYKDLDAPNNAGSSPLLAPFPLNGTRVGASHRIYQVQDLKRTRLPPSLQIDEENLWNSRSTTAGRSLSSSPSLEANQLREPNFAMPLAQSKIPAVSTYLDTYKSWEKMPTKPTNQVSKRSRSPPNLLANGGYSVYGVHSSKRPPSSSPPKLRQNFPSNALGSHTQQQSLTSVHNNADIGSMKPMSFPVSKRTKLPFAHTSDHVLHDDCSAVQDDNERELDAKAKRLARFKDDLEQPAQSDPIARDQRVVMKKQYQSVAEQQQLMEESSVDTPGDFSNRNAISDYEVPESSGIIVGSCLDMCPESERTERERKGDLDQYERLDGERNRSSKFLAVKKYTRTAGREAELIRPMPILLQTMDYLLNLLDKPYDDKFLGLYNFLWDRMRAVRMDLRMQHIFDLEAISMLEQMIRLHIIAMHELCEYTKGEGFSEGFDAHLNIEQMNKTSVELFHLYDDHRKKGHDVPTEREFRGYYALLKLDKHPGYKVEPAELSLDLAKMTPDMRQTPEIVFSRDVARACRTGNFITFFRLARKASYLQACLMHAHFAKLRTHALASLHCGLQNNQGIPVSQVAKWLGMEEEDIESLLVYHGLAVKEFEEPYMVKEGSFVNVDNDYPVRCSRLVYSKKSTTIVEDVFCAHLAEIVYSKKELEDPQLDNRFEQNPTPRQLLVSESFIQGIDEDIPDYETISYPEEKLKVMPLLCIPMHAKGQDENLVTPASPQVSAAHCSPEFQHDRFSPKHSTTFKHSLDKGQKIEVLDSPFLLTASRVEQETLPVVGNDFVKKSSVAHHLPVEDMEDESPVISCQQAESDVAVAGYYDEEVANAKLKLLIRIWKRYSSKRRELREQKQLAATVALSSLTLGPPICQYKTQPNVFDDVNIGGAMMRRYELQQNSWLRMNVSDVVVSKLAGKNTTAKCLCWKVILCSQGKMHNITEPIQQNDVGVLAAWSWLLSKLIPDNNCIDDELVVSSPGLSIWKKCVPDESGRDLTSCFSVIKEVEFQNLNETAEGANAIVFLALECFPWEVQKKRLNEVLMALPSGSSLPLLVLSSSCKSRVDPSTITEELGLHDIDKSLVMAFNILFLKDDPLEKITGFFSDNHLRRGLEWLADVSPPQPVLDCIKTRELVLYHLNPSLEALDNINTHYTNPNAIISAINESLDQSAREVAAAAQAAPACWPCPEIALLGQCGNGNNHALRYLPSIGWNSAARIQPLVHAIATCKLPAFEEDVSWLHKGTYEISDIETQTVQLESCLLKYLTEDSKLMGRLIGAKEANIMLQKYTRLELHNYSYYLMPNWVAIFRRAFNWQLTNLADDRLSSAYVLKQLEFPISPEASYNFNVEDRSLFSSALGQPSLDEMVEVCCACLTPNAPNEQEDCFETHRHMTLDDHNVGNASNEVQMSGDEMNVEDDGKIAISYNNNYVTDVMKKKFEPLLATKAVKESNKLSELLEKCNIAQNMIDKKLSVYF